MLSLEFTRDEIFGFEGPNLCFLGNEEDFLNLSKAIVDLTGVTEKEIYLSKLNNIKFIGEPKEVVFASKPNAGLLAILDETRNVILFQLDKKYWDRLFKYFILMSWKKATYYLNSNENCLNDLQLEQDCHFICSSEFNFLSNP